VLTAGCGLFGGNGNGGQQAQRLQAVDGPCPKNLVIQTDWLPEMEHGGVYQLIGPSGTADKGKKVYSGPLQARYRGPSGVDTVEIRAGGAAIDNRTVSDVMMVDDTIYLGFINTDDVIADRAKSQSFTGVASTLDLSPQMLMWSPARYTVAQFSDLAKTRAKVLYFPGATYIDFLLSRGYITQDQLDPSYDGSPARWLATRGDVIQQGFATNEVYTYENELGGWRRPIDFFLIHWLGYENYPAMLSVRSDRLAQSSACLKLLVPVLQRAWVDFLTEPNQVSAAIVSIDDTYNTFFKVSKALNDEAIRKMRQYQIASNGADSIYGNFDEDRVSRFVAIVQDIYRKRGRPLPTGISTSDIVTNQFIDPAISLARQ
jgi:hypothetical protein